MMLSYAHRQCVLGGLQSQPQPQHRAFLAACSPASNPLPRQRRTIAAPLAAVASDPLSPPQDATAVPIFDKIAACVEANVSPKAHDMRLRFKHPGLHQQRASLFSC
jgi:hypothetical protein